MKTKELTRGAMVCALYGILLFINQQTALTIESSMNWIFTFPVLIYTGMYGSNMGGIVAVAMAMMTFLFGGFTTWFYSWTSILIGFNQTTFFVFIGSTCFFISNAGDMS